MLDYKVTICVSVDVDGHHNTRDVRKKAIIIFLIRFLLVSYTSVDVLYVCIDNISRPGYVYYTISRANKLIEIMIDSCLFRKYTGFLL